MSHATCLVISETGSEEEIDRLMAPYMENCCEEPDKRFMKFYDEEDQRLKEYETGSIEKVVLPSGELVYPWDNQFRDKKDPLSSPKAPPELERRKIPFKEMHATFEEFMMSYCGREKRDETYNRYGYWQNPAAKWDWYEIGGRWSGYFQLKAGCNGLKGKQYRMGAALSTASNKVDQARKGDIDFEAMTKEDVKWGAKRYDIVWAAIKDTPVNEAWRVLIADIENHGEALEKAREFYHSQPRVQAFRKVTNTEEGRKLFGFFSSVEDYNFTREEYLKRIAEGAISTHAVLLDGKWIEYGQMGWFGSVHDEKDKETWDSQFTNILKQVPDDAILTLVDFHI